MKHTARCFISLFIFNFSFFALFAQDTVQPKFTGGDISKYFQDHIVYPETERKANISGKVYVTFVVEKDGSVSTVTVLRGAPGGPGLDSEAVRVVRAMPNWVPGMMGGQPVRVQYNIPISFELQSSGTTADSVKSPAPNNTKDTTGLASRIFLVVQHQPKFPSGDLSKYLEEHIVYPEKERENGVTGKVFVTFVIEKDGSVSNVRVLRGVSYAPEFDAEAVRVVSSMPRWTPGMQNGHPVRVQYNLPIDFEMEGTSSDPNFVHSMSDVDTWPKYSDGDPVAYLYQHISNDKRDVQQEMFVSFIVNKDGSVTDVSVTNGSTTQLTDDIIHAISTMAIWTPGIKNGTAVRVKYYIKLEPEQRVAQPPHPHNDSFGE